LIPGVFDLCADFQMAVTRHLCQRLQRGMEFVALRKLLCQDNKTLVCRSSEEEQLLLRHMLCLSFLIFTELSMNVMS